MLSTHGLAVHTVTCQQTIAWQSTQLMTVRGCLCIAGVDSSISDLLSDVRRLKSAKVTSRTHARRNLHAESLADTDSTHSMLGNEDVNTEEDQLQGGFSSLRLCHSSPSAAATQQSVGSPKQALLTLRHQKQTRCIKQGKHTTWHSLSMQACTISLRVGHPASV